MNILLADDEHSLLKFIERGLSAEGYTCHSVSHLQAVLPSIKKHSPRIVILDRLFGDEDSLSVLTSIKRLPHPPMVLILTALDDVHQRVAGLHKGADDYLCKPFDFDELLARLTALARRGNQTPYEQNNELKLGTLIINIDERIAHVNNKELKLTKIEFDLLLYLAENSMKVLSRERIISRVWHSHSDPQTNIVDVYISRLRSKLGTIEAINIQTLRGNGYRLNLK